MQTSIRKRKFFVTLWLAIPPLLVLVGWVSLLINIDFCFSPSSPQETIFAFGYFPILIFGETDDKLINVFDHLLPAHTTYTQPDISGADTSHFFG